MSRESVTQNMCSAHIFKLCIMYLTQNMCSAHIFKVAYRYLYACICDALAFFADTCSLTVRFCGHCAFYYLSGFVDTAPFTICPVLLTPRLLLSVRFCGHSAFYCLSGFVDTSPTRQRKIPVLWNFHRRDFLIKRGKIAFCQTAVSHRQRAAAPLTALEERGTLHPRRAAAP